MLTNIARGIKVGQFYAESNNTSLITIGQITMENYIFPDLTRNILHLNNVTGYYYFCKHFSFWYWSEDGSLSLERPYQFENILLDFLKFQIISIYI